MGWLATGRRGGLVGNRYRLIERLGTGGMSVVWRAHDEVLGRAVAVKMLSPQLADDSTFRDRLRQEALAAARLCHPHITGIFDFGESPLDEHLTVPYVVMELNDGESVSARLHRQGSFPWREAVIIGAEVASALAAAHARGVVHRDVTPANIMLTGAGAKVVDFGISALIGQRDAAADGSLLGTPAYLAPERLNGSPVSPATDVYALGLLLYRTLTGRFPWPAANTTEALRAHLFADPEPVPPLPGLPPEVSDLCLRCLAKRPERRPTAAEVAEALSALVGLKPIIRPAAAREAAPGPRPSPRPLPPPGSRPHRVPAHPPRTGPGTSRARRPGGPPRGGALGRLGDAVVAGRHRVQAGVATVILIATMGLVWSSTREPEEVGTAQAAAAGAVPGAVAPHGSGCKVRYRVQRDSGTDFGAQVTLINTGEHVLSGWRLEFAFAGGQRLTESPKRLSQRGRKLMLEAREGARLRPGRSETIVLSGSYRVSNPLPLAFKLNGHKCRAEVLGAVLTPTTADLAPAPPASTRRPAASTPPPRTPPRREAPAPRKDPPPKSGFSVKI
jgi:hypothetical protein